MTRGGLPHSDIFGSKLVCSSPKLFAACHVLHRLLAPRHSPYTLSSLTIRNSKLTRTNCLHISWSATVPCNTACPPSPAFASCDATARLRRMNVVVGKNYRVQNIQLSKIRWGPSPHAPGLAHLRGPFAPRRSLATVASLRDSYFAKESVNVGCQSEQELNDLSRRRCAVREPASPKLPSRLVQPDSAPAKAGPHSLTETFFRRRPFGLWRDWRKRALSFQRSAALIRLACRAVAPQGAKAGGEYRARTGDLLVANQALSQLS